jgi:ribose transport system ATP-binding protein
MRSTADAVRQGIGFLPESRKDQGLVMNLSVRANMTLPHLKDHTRWGRVDQKKEMQAVREQIEKLRIVTPSTEQRVLYLSGGNQQKVIIARWLATKCRLLIFDEPTRGVDVGAKSEIYELMRTLTAQGVGIIMVSSDLPEILRMSDRILVMAEGRLTGELLRNEANQEKIMALMLGGKSIGSKAN